MSTAYRIMRVRKNLLIPGIWNTESQSSLKTRMIHGRNLHLWIILESGSYIQVYLEREIEEASASIFQKIFKDRNYVSKMYAAQLVAGRDLVKLSQKIIGADLSKFSIAELMRVYQQIQQGWVKYDQINVLPWFLGADKLRNYIYSMLPGISSGEFELLLTSDEKSFSAQEEQGILDAALLAKKSKVSMSAARKLADRYFWIPFGYDGPATYDADHYSKAIREASKQPAAEIKTRLLELRSYKKIVQSKQAALLRKFALKEDLLRLTADMRKMAVMTDQRKEFQFQSHVALWRVMQALAKKLRINPMFLKFISFKELKQNIKNTDQLLELASRRKNGLVIFEGDNGKLRAIEGREAQNLKTRMLPKTSKLKSLQGQVASTGRKPIVMGRARVLLSPKSISMVKSGEILIATMTSPEYVPGMRKAAAIITDEGGVTSHASIVSRELNKPCIIATKFATQVFKDGDMVEVDAVKGIVRKI